jgi:hypothetical protein
MNDFIANLIEIGVQQMPYSDELFKSDSYTLIGMTFICLPVLLLTGFYYAWNPTFGRWYHWLLTLFLSTIAVAGISYGILGSSLARYFDNPDYKDLNRFIIKFILLTCLYAFITGVAFSFLLKLRSSNNRNNPI